MKLEILESARKDLVDGFHFYEKQADGIGRYFLESMYSDIDSLIDNAGIHPILFEKMGTDLRSVPIFCALPAWALAA